MTFPPRRVSVEIDLGAIQRNYRLARTHGGSRAFAVIKADAYGHGATAVARALVDADGFAVVTLGEAAALRDAGITQPILVLQGPLDAVECAEFAGLNLWPVIHDLQQHAWFSTCTERHRLDAWLKVDTGMGRLGVQPRKALTLLSDRHGAVRWQGMLSHLACADEPGNAHTVMQIREFSSLRDRLSARSFSTSLANSAAIIGWPEARADWCRAGLMLYGCNPLAVPLPDAITLEPAMTVRAPLIAVRRCEAGTGIGYGQTYRCPESMMVGYAAIGYGDGLPRVLDASARVLVAGRSCAIIGRVSMDSIALDLRRVPTAKPGDSVYVWGPDLPVETMARAAGTISYEIVTGIVGARRYITSPGSDDTPQRQSRAAVGTGITRAGS